MFGWVPRACFEALELEYTSVCSEAGMLRAENAQLRTANAALAERVSGLVTLGDNLKAKLAELKARLKANSHNSSKPPSSDGPEVSPRRGRKPSGRRRGGQKDHAAHSRPLAPKEEVDHFEDVKPPVCEQCGTGLSGEDPDPRRHQVIDIPPVKLHIVEYLLHKLQCPDCGHWTQAKLPQGVGASPCGPRVHAMVALLVGRFRQGKRGVKALLGLVYGLDVSLGAISKMERRVSAALEEPVAEAQTAVRDSEVVHADETRWRQM